MGQENGDGAIERQTLMDPAARELSRAAVDAGPLFTGFIAGGAGPGDTQRGPLTAREAEPNPGQANRPRSP